MTLDLTGPYPRTVRADSLTASPFRMRDLALGADYSVHPDGKRFVWAKDAGGGVKIVIVTNWLNEVKAKLAGK